jgi:hypothetical protein
LSSRVTSLSICNLRTILRAGAERGPAVAYRLVTTIHALAEICDAETRIVPRACGIAPVAELSGVGLAEPSTRQPMRFSLQRVDSIATASPLSVAGRDAEIANISPAV